MANIKFLAIEECGNGYLREIEANANDVFDIVPTKDKRYSQVKVRTRGGKIRDFLTTEDANELQRRVKNARKFQ